MKMFFENNLLNIHQHCTYPQLFGMMFGVGKNNLNIYNVKSPQD